MNLLSYYDIKNRVKVSVASTTAGCRPIQPVFYKQVITAHFALLAAGCTPSKPSAAPPDGKALYAAYCVSCHGADGRNDRSGAVPAMRLGAANALPAADWRHLVTTGHGQMPAFQNRLNSVQLEALRAYIRQLTTQP